MRVLRVMQPEGVVPVGHAFRHPGAGARLVAETGRGRRRRDNAGKVTATLKLSVAVSQGFIFRLRNFSQIGRVFPCLPIPALLLFW
jgi:hypothetical protein